MVYSYDSFIANSKTFSIVITINSKTFSDSVAWFYIDCERGFEGMWGCGDLRGFR